ncbi:TPA: hypothetical protein N0F65_003448 [Lagenidium giganteum]|uniref:Uncharacterized protein n=1 Tax=Lagenidium giganteum TaxID=4803 RepID=A0AAV2YEP9_9STRA|nr:TPA: hypothetical protein N0F65_003448 [Lagenidium giganteum]
MVKCTEPSEDGPANMYRHCG